ncbi:MAG TPA: hypothetical protein VL049_03005 [Candidatus Dormibacteraeota bacterium]|nr:hypothetical protein [Candidatus Dormibacteraeota bacterium]
MASPTGREVLLTAFDRLFDRAADKLHLECTAEERAEAKRFFTERYDDALRILDQAEFPAIDEPVMARLEAAIDRLSLAYIAGHLATGPLALHVQEFVRTLAVRAAEQRVLEHLANRADESFGGN